MIKKAIFISGGIFATAAVTCGVIVASKIYKPVATNNIVNIAETTNISEEANVPSSSDYNVSDEIVDGTTDIVLGNTTDNSGYSSDNSDITSNTSDSSSKIDINKEDEKAKDKSLNSSNKKSKTTKEKSAKEAKESTIGDLLSEQQKALLNEYQAKLKAAELLKNAQNNSAQTNNVQTSKASASNTQYFNTSSSNNTSQSNNSSSNNNSSSSNSSSSNSNTHPIYPVYEAPAKNAIYNVKTASVNGTAYSFENLGGGNLAGIPFNYTNAKALYDKDNTGLIPERNGDTSTKKKYTVLLYICGTDLESTKNADGTYRDKGTASTDLFELIKSNYDLDKVNVLVCAGGTNHWVSPYMNGTYATNTIDTDGDGVLDSKVNNDNLRCNIYAVDPTKFSQVRDSSNDKDFKTIFAEEMPCLASFDAGAASNIGNAQLLAGFLDFAAEYFPAENYGLFLNNHGGGVNGGICFPDSANDDTPAGKSLKAYDIEAALRSSKEFGVDSDNRLSFLAMDACMMGSVEFAYNLAPYTDYYIGSSEIETGSFNYTDIMSYINAEAKKDTINNKEVASGIVESFFSTTGSNHRGEENIIGDLMCFDSNAVYEFGKQVDNFAAEIVGLKGDSQYSDLWNICLKTIESASYHVDSMGTSDTSAGGDYEGYLDTLGLLKFIKENLNLCSTSLNAQEKEKVNIIGTLIDKALDTKFIVAGGLYYSEEEVFKCKTDVKTGELLSLNDVDKLGIWSKPVDETFNTKWSKFKCAENGATSLFVPIVFGAQLDSGADTYNNWDNAKNKSKIYTDMSILRNYSKLIDEYINYEYSDEMMKKRKELVAKIDYTQAIMPVSTSGSQSSGDAPQVLLQRFYKNGEGVNAGNQYIDYIQVKFNEEPTNDAKYTYDDVVKTVEKLKLYVDRTQTVKDKVTNTEKDIQIVIGSVDIPVTTLSGVQSALNIKADTIAKAMAYKAFGLAENKVNSVDVSTDRNENTWIVDWATRVESDNGEPYSSTIQFEGYAYVLESDKFNRKTTETDTGITPVPIIITFEECGDAADISYRFKEAKYVDESITDTIEYYSFAHYFFDKYTDSNGNADYIKGKLEEYDGGMDFVAPIYKAGAGEKNILISIYSTDYCEEYNSYNIGFTKADDRTQVVFLPTEDENKKKSTYDEEDSLSDAIWGTKNSYTPDSQKDFADKPARAPEAPAPAPSDIERAYNGDDNENAGVALESQMTPEITPEATPEVPTDVVVPEAIPEVPADVVVPEVIPEVPADVVVPEVIPEVPADVVVPEAIPEVPAEVVGPEVMAEAPVQEVQDAQEIIITLIETVGDENTPSGGDENNVTGEESSNNDENNDDGGSSEVIFIDTTEHREEDFTENIPDDVAA